jgi:hypothetical protein
MRTNGNLVAVRPWKPLADIGILTDAQKFTKHSSYTASAYDTVPPRMRNGALRSEKRKGWSVEDFMIPWPHQVKKKKKKKKKKKLCPGW